MPLRTRVAVAMRRNVGGMVDAIAKDSAIPGVFITFEGGDGVGKSTHIRLLEEALKKHGHEVVRVREPGGTVIGEALRALVLDPAHTEMTPEAELLIYEAARAQIVAEVIAPALERGAVVLCDRFFDSTVAYQAFARGLDREFVDAANAFAVSGTVPDRTLLLVCENAEEGLERAQDIAEPDRLEQEGIAFHEKVRRGFAALAADDPERVRVIDSQGDVDETARAIAAELVDLFPWMSEEAPRG